MSKQDYYKILGVNKNAPLTEIKQNYRKLAKKYHPDVSKEPNAEAKFKEVNEAYEVLKNPETRKRYDTMGHSGVNGQHQSGFGGFEDIFSNFNHSRQGGPGTHQGGFGGFGDIFNDFFGGGTKRRNAPRKFNAPRPGQNIHTTVEINYQELLFGTDISLVTNLTKTCKKCNGLGAPSKKDIAMCRTCNGQGIVTMQQNTPLGRIQSQVTCPDCHGGGEIIMKKCSDCHGSSVYKEKETITIKLPHSINTENQIVVRSMAHAGLFNGPRGDIYLQVKIKPNHYFSRQGNNLLLTLDISYLDAILGNTIDIPTLDGNVQIKLAPGTQNNSTFSIQKYGFFISRRSERRGDLIVKVQIKTPIRISKKEQRILRDISADTNFELENSDINKF